MSEILQNFISYIFLLMIRIWFIFKKIAKNLLRGGALEEEVISMQEVRASKPCTSVYFPSRVKFF